MKQIRNFIICAISILILFNLTACEDEYYINTYWSENGFYCKREKENKIAIGNISFIPENGALFVPSEIDGKTVSMLGFKLFDSDGFFYNCEKDEPLVKRYYAPNTIESVNTRYMQYCHNLKFFYCGNSNIDLSCLCLGYGNEIYIPDNCFDKLLDNSHDCLANIKKANIAYMLDEETYYYVDYYETNSKILYPPPPPIKTGYKFDGWYTERTFLNKWVFSDNTVQNSELEIKLYSKWIKI